MEAILIIIAFFLAPVIIRLFFRGVSAVGKTAVGKGSLSENLDLEFRGMSEFSIQVKEKEVDDVPFTMYQVLGKGRFPNKYKTQLTFVTQLLDVTDKDEDPKYVISSSEEFQSDESPVFIDVREGPEVEGGFGFVSPAVVGIIVKDILVPPKSGTRDIRVFLTINDGNGDPLDRYVDTVSLVFKEKGYEEAYEARKEAFILDIQLAVHVAFSDNEFHKTEGDLIKKWMVKILESYDGEEKDSLKKLFNETFKDAYEEANKGKLSLSKITKRFNEIGNDQLKYQGIELCLDVMAADGIADEGELEAIRKICKSLDLDFDEVQKLKDVRMKDLKMRVTADTSLEEMIGIQADWDEDKIKKHLRNEFKKWNSRLTSSKNEEERNSSQEKLDLIAELRKKYGG